MAAQYNIGEIGPGLNRHKKNFERRLVERLRDLGIDDSQIAFCDAKSILGRNPKTPIVTIYFGDTRSADVLDINAITSLKSAASIIIPVAPDLDSFNTIVPAELHEINGAALADDDQEPNEIVNLVLENLGLLRRLRRLFISYRHASSTNEAIQIRHELDSRGYDVFLDTYSVAKGDPFQEVLWQRLADSDVAVLLDTPDFLDSRWTKEELAQAEAMTIGIVQVIWPSHNPAPYTDLCERLYLRSSDFSSNGGLKQKVLEDIAKAVEQLRARSLAARHNNLVREFCDAATSKKVATFVQPERFIIAKLGSGRTVAAIPGRRARRH